MGTCSAQSGPERTAVCRPALGRAIDPAKGLDAAKRLAAELKAGHPDDAASLLEAWTTCSRSAASA